MAVKAQEKSGDLGSVISCSELSRLGRSAVTEAKNSLRRKEG